ncbi:MAG: Asp-tRNA(Asn)/Glu-tRNA(Gln) amidotransferase subunit GatC [Pseudomonadales bacterium]|nr:Asp-tRNA(Asn)/Glu-tRNA(Gln) amidotransferase subunit GatC [Pseudomonadales bacterium]
MSTITPQQVKHIANLANIPVTEGEVTDLADAFEETLDVVANLQSVDTSKVEPTHQVTGLENVLREDVVDEAHMFTQAEALANAKETHEGFIVVPIIIDQE